jgi:hypothetical protein
MLEFNRKSQRFLPRSQLHTGSPEALYRSGATAGRISTRRDQLPTVQLRHTVLLLYVGVICWMNGVL